MSKPLIDIKKVLTSDDQRVEAIASTLEASSPTAAASPRWTERLTPSTRGGKELG